MIIADTKEFGAALRQRRKELGYTQAYIAEFTGMSISFLSELENGKSTAEIGKAIKVANLLGFNLELNVRG